MNLAVHLHMHYFEMWFHIKELLTNMGDYPYDLFVTMTKEQPELIQDIKSFHPNAQIWVVENRGYDVGPFIEFLHRIDLNRYDLILKIHTKNNAPGSVTHIGHYVVGRQLWAKLLIHSLLGSPELFKKNIMLFEKKPTLGMIGSKYLVSSGPKRSESICRVIGKILENWGYCTVPIKFLAGTMFMCRAKLLEPIKTHYQLSDFEPTDGSVRDGTLAHIMERLFGCVVEAQGYKIRGCGPFCSRLFLQRIWRFVYTSKITNSGYCLIKIFRLPVYRYKLKGK